MAIGMDLIEMDFAAAGGGRRVGLDRDGDEAETKIPFPAGARRHGSIPLFASYSCAWKNAG
jgi:hypothetical protein